MIFLSFVEECILNPDYEGFVGGRLEIYINDDPYANDEKRFLTRKQEEFYRFRDRWDMKRVTPKQLETVISSLENKFNNK